MAWRNYQPKSKYGNKKIHLDGIVFDSLKEANRYQELKLMERAGLIKDLRQQVKYVLIPAQREPEKIGTRGGKVKGKVVERECSYIADFVYYDNNLKACIVEDTKGFKTKEYIIKRKLMLFIHKIKIVEV